MSEILTAILIAAGGAAALSFASRLLPVKDKSAASVMSPGYGSEYYSFADARGRFMNGKCKRWPYMREIYQAHNELHISLLEAAEVVVEHRHGEQLPAHVATALQSERAQLTTPAILRNDAPRWDTGGETLKLDLKDNDFASLIDGTVFDKRENARRD